VVLVLLEEGPRHGYDIIKALEERSHGVYSPSPGVVYPTLTFLEEAGYTTAASEGNKRIYSITDAGRAHLHENREAADAALRQMDWVGDKVSQAREWADRAGRGEWASRGGRDRDRGEDDPSLAALNKARRRLRALIADAMEEGDAEERRRLADILNRAADEALGKTS
jgi:DNA-binding PadR family transcriptional regulator